MPLRDVCGEVLPCILHPTAGLRAYLPEPCRNRKSFLKFNAATLHPKKNLHRILPWTGIRFTPYRFFNSDGMVSTPFLSRPYSLNSSVCFFPEPPLSIFSCRLFRDTSGKQLVLCDFLKGAIASLQEKIRIGKQNRNPFLRINITAMIDDPVEVIWIIIITFFLIRYQP